MHKNALSLFGANNHSEYSVIYCQVITKRTDHSAMDSLGDYLQYDRGTCLKGLSAPKGHLDLYTTGPNLCPEGTRGPRTMHQEEAI